MTIDLILQSILLGFGLAMDAFSVSVADGLSNPGMKRRIRIRIATVFAVFQFLMPLIGWFFVSLLAEKFSVVEKFLPWLSFGILLFIGGKMILEEVRSRRKEKEDTKVNPEEEEKGIEETKESPEEGTEDNQKADQQDAREDMIKKLGWGALIVQGIATSLDALSVGFTIAEKNVWEALICSMIIGVVTWILCIVGVTVGHKLGKKIAGFAGFVGGTVLILIGMNILVRGIFHI